jgi:low affinity Fe/Cu permease
MIGNAKSLLGMAFLVLVWAAAGPIMRYDANWQLIINTFSSIVCILLLVLAQNDSNRNMKALHIKLDEVIRSHDQADNALINVEIKPEAVLDEKLAALGELADAAKLLNKDPKSGSDIMRADAVFEKLKTDSALARDIRGPEHRSEDHPQ